MTDICACSAFRRLEPCLCSTSYIRHSLSRLEQPDKNGYPALWPACPCICHPDGKILPVRPILTTYLWTSARAVRRKRVLQESTCSNRWSLTASFSRWPAVNGCPPPSAIDLATRLWWRCCASLIRRDSRAR